MDVWDAMCRTIMSAGQRRGAMMATLDAIIRISRLSSRRRRIRCGCRNFNLSVLVTDAFVDAVRRNAGVGLF